MTGILATAAACLAILCNMSFLKEAIFLIALALIAIAAAGLAIWLLEQSGWINP
jgi:hypothetical protein